MDRERMDCDVLIVGAGPAGLSAAIRLKQVNDELEVIVLEKGSEVGAHIISGAVLDTRALSELIPDWRNLSAPIDVPVRDEKTYLLRDSTRSWKIPAMLVPRSMHNRGNYIISLGRLCRWLAEQADALNVNILTGFAAAELLFDKDGAINGVITGDMGLNRDGKEKKNFEPGIELHARFTLLAEGARGHLGREVIDRFDLARGKDEQHYAIGLKELWEIESDRHKEGLAIHTAGWPLGRDASGGGFLYHYGNTLVEVGLIVDLGYRNPFLSPYDEFQRLKHQAVFRTYLDGGKCIGYGARAITKGGLNALPEAGFPGGLIIGCNAGTLNAARMKGIHTAMKSGMLAAEAVHETYRHEGGDSAILAARYADVFRGSWLYGELHQARNFAAALHRWGNFRGGVYSLVEQNLLRTTWPFNLRDSTPDYESLLPAAKYQEIDYPRSDGKLGFDLTDSVYRSNTFHEEDQPVHLRILDPSRYKQINISLYDAPEQRYCPAGVYEIISDDQGMKSLQINASNCLHCKTCDIKDPAQNILWVPPEGTGGPNYVNM